VPYDRYKNENPLNLKNTLKVQLSHAHFTPRTFLWHISVPLVAKH